MKINPLLVYWRPKDLPKVIDNLKKIPCDQLWINYFPYPYPQRITNNFFKNHKEYTHLIIVPNDLVATKEVYLKLYDLVGKNDFEVCCGVCNVDNGKYKDKLVITSNLPVIGPYHERRYFWISKNRYPNMIIQPPFAGHPMMWIKRSVMEKIGGLWVIPIDKKNKEGWPLWEKSGGYASDLALAHSLAKHNIKINCYTGAMMEHDRFYGEMLVGKKLPKVEFLKYNANLEHEPKEQVCSLR